MRLSTYKTLTDEDRTMISANLLARVNIEGMTIDELSRHLFVFVNGLFAAVMVIEHKNGKELFIEWMGGKDFKRDGKEMWETLKSTGKVLNCRWISAVARKRALVRMYKNVGVQFSAQAFMEEIK